MPSLHFVRQQVTRAIDSGADKCAAEARDIRTALAGDEYTIGTLVFRSYAQFHADAEPLRLRALSLIDRMCEEGLQSASQNLVQFER